MRRMQINSAIALARGSRRPLPASPAPGLAAGSCTHAGSAVAHLNCLGDLCGNAAGVAPFAHDGVYRVVHRWHAVMPRTVREISPGTRPPTLAASQHPSAWGTQAHGRGPRLAAPNAEWDRDNGKIKGGTPSPSKLRAHAAGKARAVAIIEATAREGQKGRRLRRGGSREDGRGLRTVLGGEPKVPSRRIRQTFAVAKPLDLPRPYVCAASHPMAPQWSTPNDPSSMTHPQ